MLTYKFIIIHYNFYKIKKYLIKKFNINFRNAIIYIYLKQLFNERIKISKITLKIV